MLKFTPESLRADAEPLELALHPGRAGQFASASEVDAENLEDGSLQPESNSADTVDEEEAVRGDLQTREAYLKKGEDLIRSLL